MPDLGRAGRDWVPTDAQTPRSPDAKYAKARWPFEEMRLLRAHFEAAREVSARMALVEALHRHEQERGEAEARTLPD